MSDDDHWLVTPAPGLCVKFKNVEIQGRKEKLFVNLCSCEELPPPIEDLDEASLAQKLESSPDDYRIPLSVGEMRLCEDHTGQESGVIDVLINTSYLESKVIPSDLFFSFTLTVACELINQKHSLSLESHTAILLKNRKVMGTLAKQKIKKKPSKPLVQMMGNETVEPQYKLMSKLNEQHQRVLEATVDLPGVESIEDIDLGIGGDRLVLNVDARYALDLYLNFDLLSETVEAQFDVATNNLSFTVVCQ